ncbi:hypothetical protein F5Y14DRAFT_410827 [Nemania sp. NC0429]|nr:hypothetical protein F5Y14DRAFT_410827 [Nemania sp. NC0429]
MQLLYLTVILASLARVRSQDLNSTIVGCAQLDCPASTADTANDNCTVADKSFTYVGLTQLTSSQESLQRLSWTKGFKIIDLPNNNRTFQNSFYLGSPPDLELRGTGACSVFLHGVSASLAFGGDEGRNETSQGTCADAMGSECVSALLDRAKSFFQDPANDNTSNTNRCSALQEHLHNNVDGPCLRISGGSWTNLSSTGLTGDGSPQPISQEDNSTSTCWPVLPKQNQLTHVTDYTVPGTLLAKDAETALLAITPILTVFYPAREESVVRDVDASLTCVKVLGPPRASLDTISDGSGEGFAASLSPSMTTLVAMGSLLAVLFVAV